MASVEAAVKVCEKFERLLKGTFGPKGLDIMLCSSSGNILITNCGSVVLKSVSVVNPVGRLIVEQIVSHSAITGDGATAFVLVLSETLREICKSLKIRTEPKIKELLPDQRKSLTALSKAFTRTESVATYILQDLSTKFKLTAQSHGTDNKSVISSIIRMHLNGKYPTTTVALFSDLLCRFIYGTSPTFKKESIEYLIDSFPQLCLDVAGPPVTSSKVLPGVLIPREFSTDTKSILPDQDNSTFRFIVVQCLLDEPEHNLNTTFELQKSTDLDFMLTFKRRNVLKMFGMFQEKNVKLILSTEAVSDVVLHYCRHFNIAFVQMVPLEYVSLICRYGNIQPTFYSSLEEAVVPDIHFGKSPSCKVELIGDHSYVFLEFCSNVESDPLPCQLLLCAPNQGLCQQNSISLLNTLKCVRMSFNQDKTELLVLPGGGSVEFIISEELRKYSMTCEDAKLSEACSSFSKGLIAVPRGLHLNSVVNSSLVNNFIHLLPAMKLSWFEEQIPLGIDCTTGTLFDPAKANILEPFLGKQLLISHVLQLLAQLLRINGIEYGVR